MLLCGTFTENTRGALINYFYDFSCTLTYISFVEKICVRSHSKEIKNTDCF